MVQQRYPAPDVSPQPQPGIRGIAIVISALLAIVVDGSSTSIINTGLPYLQGITAASPDEGSWILTSFNAAYYAFILFSPWMVARCGRRRLIITALLGFSLLSLLLAATSNFALFLVLRFLQGACLGCVFVPAVLLFFTSLSATALRYAAPGFVLTAIAGSTVGTLVGGYVADEFGGNVVFIPSAIATAVTALLIALAVRARDTVARDLPLDLIGLTLSILAFGAMQFLANDGERRNWLDDPSIVAAVWLLAIALGAFLWYELVGTRNPHVNLRMFAQYRNLAIGSLINIVIGATGYSVTLFVGYLQGSIGATPTVAGALVLVRLATYIVGVPAAFLLTLNRVLSVRAVVLIAAGGSAIGFLGFAHSMTTTAELATFVDVSLFFGLFYAMLSQPIGALVIGSIPLPLLAAGISIYKLSSPIGLMIATGWMQFVIDHRTAVAQSAIAGDLHLGSPAVAPFVYDHHGSTASLARLATAQAQTLADAYGMALFAVVLLAIVPLVFLVKVAKAPAKAADV